MFGQLKKKCPTETVVFPSCDYLNVCYDTFLDSTWNSKEATFPLSNSESVQLTTLTRVQPDVERQVTFSRTYSADERSRKTQSWMRKRSASAGSRPRRVSPEMERQPCNNSMRDRASSDSTVSRYNMNSVCETYSIKISVISDSIKESLLFGYDMKEDNDDTSQMSTYNDSVRNSTATVHCSMELIHNKGGIQVHFHLRKITGLPLKGSGLLYDPVAVIALLPGTQQSQVSKIHHQTINPSFDESFTFFAKKKKKSRPQYIRLTVYDAEHRGEFMEIGHAILPLTPHSSVNHPISLHKSSVPHGKIGDILLFLTFSQKRKCLTVGILRGRQLVLDAANKHPNRVLHFKVALLFAGEQILSKQSDAVSCSPCPFVNAIFEFYLPAKFLHDVTIVVRLLQTGIFSETVIGRVVIGPYDQSAQSGEFWGDDLQNEHVLKDWYALTL